MLNLHELTAKLSSKLHGWLEAGVVMLPNALLASLLVLFALLVSRTVQKLTQRVVHRATKNAPISELLGTLARVVVIVMALFFGLGLLGLDKTVTSLLAGVGVVGLALGFAFQDIAANFMSGFMMAVRRPFDIGDFVEVAGHKGRIKHIALRASEIETLDGLAVIVPNKEVFQKAIINYTMTPNRRLDFKMGVAYTHDMKSVRRVVVEAVQNVPARDPTRDVEFFFEEFAESSIDFSVRIWLDHADEKTLRNARSEAMIAIKEAFDREHFTIPFPIRTLDFGAEGVGGTSIERLPLKLARDTAA
jgi:small conductance mechanosensitive channel